jgi:hypothetical protein
MQAKTIRSRRTSKTTTTALQTKHAKPLTVPVTLQQIIHAVNKMKKKEREAFLEDLLAATSPAYLASIREAREDYRRGRVLSHEEVFGHHN